MDTIIRLYPLPQREFPLEGLYLQPHMCAQFFGTYEITRADTAIKRDGCD